VAPYCELKEFASVLANEKRYLGFWKAFFRLSQQRILNAILWDAVVFDEPAASIFRAQGATWRKVSSKLLVSLYDTTQLCISERGKVKKQWGSLGGSGVVWHCRYCVSRHLDTSVLGSQHAYMPVAGGGVCKITRGSANCHVNFLIYGINQRWGVYSTLHKGLH